MSTKHPTDRGDRQRGWFDQVAETASNFTSSPVFFGICLLLVAAWAASYALGWGSEARDLLGYGMAALSLMLLALLKNSELRAEHAIQRKLDAIAAALMHERSGDSEAAQDDLERAIGMHDEV